MELFWYDIRTMDEDAYAAALALLSPQRQERVAGIALPDDRKRTVAAEWLLRTEAGKRLGVAPKDVPLVTDEESRPVLEGADLYCSVSHSGAWAVCALSDKPIGVDVEVIRAADEKFMRRICSEDELRYVRYGDEGCFARFWECWTAKEALFKLTQQGPLLSLSRFALPQNAVLEHVTANGCSVTAACAL